MGWITLLLAVALAVILLRGKWKNRRGGAGQPETPDEVPGWREALDAKYRRGARMEDPGDGEELSRQEERDGDYREQWSDMLTQHLGKKEAKRLEPCYRKLFGGDIQCLFNFTMLMSRVDHGHKGLIVPPDDHYRPRFETLAATGAVLRGDAAQPIDLLWGLGMDQLRTLADAVGAKRAQSKAELRKRIEAQGAEAVAAAWPALGIPESDIFLLDPDRIRRLCA